ncbi:unnamed protein product [Sphagnum jensenii]|uniref:Uncharacterized protein n=1 Tax=Sphagnum jensenii TaxID=128206 RepID=A0ABP0XAJ3_9BRYO
MKPKNASLQIGHISTILNAYIFVLWATYWISIVRCSDVVNVHDGLIRSEGWHFNNKIETFTNATNTTTTTPKVSSSAVTLIDGDFESMNLTGIVSTNTTMSFDNTTSALVNWVVGNVIQVLPVNMYMQSAKWPGSFCVHLNNPNSTTGSTSGSITTTLAINPATGKVFTVQFDIAKHPDSPVNSESVIKISSISGATVNGFGLNKPTYNTSDTRTSISWSTQSFIYTGTGVATNIKIESMSEKYGSLVDNIKILTGKHALSTGTHFAELHLWQKIMPIFTFVAMSLALSYPSFGIASL